MNKSDTINAKEIRQDLEGFLKRVKTGKPLTVIYRSKPFVTINEPIARTVADSPGSVLSVKRSIETAKLLRSSTDGSTVAEDYNELLEQKYGKA